LTAPPSTTGGVVVGVTVGTETVPTGVVVGTNELPGAETNDEAGALLL
jgi:hypothetical protein